jgi:hypothetical protein
VNPLAAFAAAGGLFFLVTSNCQGQGELASQPRDDFWVPNGSVHTLVEADGILYVGGVFDYVSPVSATGGAFDLISGTADPDFPKVNGAIRAVMADGEGGWFIGGLFTAVGDVAMTNLAHVLPDNSVHTEWQSTPDDEVLALALSGTMLYVGGRFTTIGGEQRSYLAALDSATGRIQLDWRADAATFSLKPGSVNALLLSGDSLFVGGFFSFVNGAPREHIASIDAASGRVTDWYPNAFSGGQAFSRVDALAISNGILYVGGTFRAVGADGANQADRAFLAAFDTTKNGTASLTDWNPGASGPVTSLAVLCETVYVGGSFTNLGGQPRNFLGALARTTGRPTEWSPDADGEVLALAVLGQTVYAGGKFSRIGGQARSFLAALDINTGQATPWIPHADFGIAGLAISGGTCLAGGALGPGGVRRANLAALDARTGRVLDWQPAALGGTIVSGFELRGVYAMAAATDLLFVGGPFTELNDGPRSHLAAVGASSGKLDPWNAAADHIVRSLAIRSNVVYVGGDFSQVGGVPRQRIAALAVSNGAVLPWDPDADEQVNWLLPLDDRIVVGGRFTRIGGAIRSRLAALDAASGLALPWNPTANDQVLASSLSGDTLYLGGVFSAVGGQLRNRVAQVDLGTGEATCWDPGPRIVTSAGERSAAVNAVVTASQRVYVGGAFNLIAGQRRNNVAALTPDCPAAATSWDPSLDGPVNALTLGRQGLVVGGDFRNLGGQYRPFLAVFPPLGSPRIATQPKSQRVASSGSVAFAVAAEGEAPLAYQWLFDGVAIAGATNSALSIAEVRPAHAGTYRVVVTNTVGLINSSDASLTVLEPVAISVQPFPQIALPGTRVELSVTATGTPAPTFQWRLNGINIPGAITPNLILPAVAAADSGIYTVVVANLTGPVVSQQAEVIVEGPLLVLADSFAASTSGSLASGVGRGSNTGATREPGEPLHAGKPGGASVWLSWTAPADGVAIFHTRGSAFDTLLAVYAGSTLNGLTEVASDDDRGGFLTSLVAFNAVKGTEYQIAIDGFAGARGNLVLSWSLETTTDELPRIVLQPQSQTVGSGEAVTFEVRAVSRTPLSYQWFFNCDAFPGETRETLTVPSVGPGQVGLYSVQVSNAARAIDSERATLQINFTRGGVVKALARDKLAEVLVPPGGPAPQSHEADRGRPRPQNLLESSAPEQFQSVGLDGAAPGEDARGPAPEGVGLHFVSVAQGTTGLQIFNTFAATKEPREPNHCGVLGGASYWFAIKAESGGLLSVSTEGSDFNTVLAVYTWAGTILDPLQEVACDDNSGRDGEDSLLRFEAARGTVYYVAVDGVNGATGTVRLSYALDGSVGSVQWAVRTPQSFGAQFSGTAGRSYRVQASSDFERWFNVLTTNLTGGAAFEFIDANAHRYPHRFYRVVPLP